MIFAPSSSLNSQKWLPCKSEWPSSKNHCLVGQRPAHSGQALVDVAHRMCMLLILEEETRRHAAMDLEDAIRCTRPRIRQTRCGRIPRRVSPAMHMRLLLLFPQNLPICCPPLSQLLHSLGAQLQDSASCRRSLAVWELPQRTQRPVCRSSFPWHSVAPVAYTVHSSLLLRPPTLGSTGSRCCMLRVTALLWVAHYLMLWFLLALGAATLKRAAQAALEAPAVATALQAVTAAAVAEAAAAAAAAEHAAA